MGHYMVEISEERITEAVEDGAAAFWSVIAKQFPEAKSCYFHPEVENALSMALKEAVRAWLEFNGVSIDETYELVN